MCSNLQIRIVQLSKRTISEIFTVTILFSSTLNFNVLSNLFVHISLAKGLKQRDAKFFVPLIECTWIKFHVHPTH